MLADPVRVEETTDQMAWGDVFIQIQDTWYSRRDRDRRAVYLSRLALPTRQETPLYP